MFVQIKGWRASFWKKYAIPAFIDYFFSEPAIGWLISFSVGKNTACIVN